MLRLKQFCISGSNVLQAIIAIAINDYLGYCKIFFERFSALIKCLGGNGSESLHISLVGV